MHRISKKSLAIGAVTSMATVGACSETNPPAEAVPAAETVVETVLACGENGRLETELHGAIRLDIAWDAENLSCTGMPRPNGEGARLRFAGQIDDRDFAIIVSMPSLDRAASATEFPSTVTLIEEGSARFFNSPDLGNCWTEIGLLDPMENSEDEFVIGGGLYCVSPLAELNGDGSVTLSEMHFVGLLDWSAK